jgi:galactosyltransferase
MSNLTVYVKSCARDRDLGFHTAIRETWGAQLKLLGVETYFCTADPTRLEMCDGDEVNFQNCPDDYMGLPYKTHRICSWASHKYKPMIYLCDNDTLIEPKKLFLWFEKIHLNPVDYAGYFCQGDSEVGKTFYYQDHMGVYPDCNTWCSGGVGYFLSWKAASAVASVLPKVWAEDMYVGQVLGPLIRSGDIKARALPLDKNVAWHFRKSRGNPVFTPELLREIYAKGGPDAFYAK